MPMSTSQSKQIWTLIQAAGTEAKISMQKKFCLNSKLLHNPINWKKRDISLVGTKKRM